MAPSDFSTLSSPSFRIFSCANAASRLLWLLFSPSICLPVVARISEFTALMLLTHSVAAAISSPMVRTAAAGSASSAAGTASFFSRASSRARIRRWTASDDAAGPARPPGSDGSATASAAGGEVRDGGDEALAPERRGFCLSPAGSVPSFGGPNRRLRSSSSDGGGSFPLLLVEFMARSPPADMRKARQQCRPPRLLPYPHTRDADHGTANPAGRITPIADDRSKQLEEKAGARAELAAVCVRGECLTVLFAVLVRTLCSKGNQGNRLCTCFRLDQYVDKNSSRLA